MQDLKHIITKLHIFEIDRQLFVISRESGEVQVVQGSANLFFELADAGNNNQQIVEDVHSALSIPTAQVKSDLETLCRQLEGIDSNAGNHRANKKTTPATDEVESDDAELLPLEEFRPSEQTLSSESFRCYSVSHCNFEVSYPSTDIELLCDSILSPMSIQPNTGSQLTEKTVGVTEKTQHVSIDICIGQEGFLLKIDQTPTYYFADENLIANYLRTAMLNAVGARVNNWLSIHAAAISDSTGDAVLFAAPSGSGKSTLSLGLCDRGANYLGDDMLIVDLDQQLLIPFPTAVNLKPGSWDIFASKYPELATIKTLHEDTRPVKYLRPRTYRSQHQNRSPKVKAIVFPQYSAEEENGLEQLPIDRTIQLLAESGCYSQVTPSVAMSKKYLEFFLGIKAYTLQYQSTEKAVELLNNAEIISV